MDSQKAAEITRRIDALAKADPHGPNAGAIAFDGDGTLWSGDVGEDFFYGVLERGDIREPALTALREEARAADVSDAGTGADVARHIYDAYLAHKFDEERVCEIMTWITAGWSAAEVDAYCTDLLVKRGLKSRLHEEVQEIVRFARASSIETFLVSASPACVVLAAARVAEMPLENVIAARPLFDEKGAMLSHVHRPIPYGAGKVSHLRGRLGARTLYAAFGDNAFDVAMLKEARVPVAVRPKPRLQERAHEVPGLVQIEKIDAIEQIENPGQTR